MKRSVRIATEALYSEHFDMDEVLRHLADPHDSSQLLLAYIAIQVSTNLSDPVCDGDITYGLQLLSAGDEGPLSLNKDLATLGWSRKAREILDRKATCDAKEYSYEAAIYRLEKAKKGPSNYEEREKWKHMATKVAEARDKLEVYLDEKASRDAAELAFQALLREVEAHKEDDKGR